jgi:hypothetical protein
MIVQVLEQIAIFLKTLFQPGAVLRTQVPGRGLDPVLALALNLAHSTSVPADSP